jgi:hypothetical protein
MRNSLSRLGRVCRKWPVLASVVISAVLVVLARPVLVASAASHRSEVQRSPHRRSNGGVARDLVEPVLDPVLLEPQAATSSSSTSSSYSTTRAFTTGMSSSTGGGGGGSSGCANEFFFSSSSCTSGMSDHVMVADDLSECSESELVQACRPVSEDLRGAWLYRSACNAAACSRRSYAVERLGPAAVVAKWLSANRTAAGLIDTHALPVFGRCTRESGLQAGCVVLDSTRIGSLNGGATARAPISAKNGTRQGH